MYGGLCWWHVICGVGFDVMYVMLCDHQSVKAIEVLCRRCCGEDREKDRQTDVVTAGIMRCCRCQPAGHSLSPCISMPTSHHDSLCHDSLIAHSYLHPCCSHTQVGVMSVSHSLTNCNCSVTLHSTSLRETASTPKCEINSTFLYANHDGVGKNMLVKHHGGYKSLLCEQKNICGYKTPYYKTPWPDQNIVVEINTSVNFKQHNVGRTAPRCEAYTFYVSWFYIIYEYSCLLKAYKTGCRLLLIIIK